MRRARPRKSWQRSASPTGWAAALAVLAAVAVGTLGLWGVGPATAEQDGTDETNDGGMEAGQQAYEQHCAMCHGSDAEGMAGVHPSLRGAVDRLTAEGVEVAIRNGREVTPPMPAFEDRLSDAEIEDVVAYIDAFPDGPRNPGGDGMGDGMGDMGMMDGMGGDGNSDTWLWIVIVVLAAVAAGLGGFVVGRWRQ